MMKLYSSVLLFFYLMNAKGVTSEPPDILRLHIQSDIRMRFATTQVTSLVANNNNYSQEVTFNVNLPEAAFISSFNMVIDGVEYPGEVKEKEQAKKAYEKAKRKGQSAGHVAKKPRDTNKFKININVAAMKNVTFEVRYQELLKRKLGLYEHSIYVNPGQPVEDLKIQVYIEESKEIRILRVPPLRSSDPTFIDVTPESTTNPDVTISRSSIKTAEITYIPSENGTLDGIFNIKYDIDRRNQFNGEILAVNGYFVHFFAPADLEPIPKDILFILDTSGSMMGRKMAQVIRAMEFIMYDLVEGDRFNIMDFDDHIVLWKKSLQPWNQGNVEDSLRWVRQRRASGGTNINNALLDGLGLMSSISNISSEGRSPIVVFLTDGAASSGVTNSNEILRNVAVANGDKIPLFSLSFGANADFGLLQKLSLRNYAVARRIYEASDSAIQLKNFYNEISAALMTDVKFKYFGNVDNDTLTNSEFHRYFNGTEAVIAGKLTDKDDSRITWNVIGSTSSGGIDVGETTEALQFSDEGKRESLLSDEDIKSIPEKLWAYLTIKQILDQMTASENQTEKEELKKRAIELSLQYKFVTPVTSMIVVKPDKKENAEEEPGDESVRDRGLPPLVPPLPGRAGQHAPRGGSYGDPHFLVKLKNLTFPICYKMPAKAGEMMTLIYDPVLQINVTAKIIEGTGSYKPNLPNRTYIGKVYIKTADLEIMVATHQIVFDGKRLIWKNETNIAFNGASCEINGKGIFVEIKISPGLTFLIRLRTLVVAKKTLSEEQYCDFETRYHQAKMCVHDRNVKMQAVIEGLERDMELLCLTGVEDKLQDGVRPTLELLRNAGIKTWMLTGDKLETATCIAKSSKLVSRNMDIHTFRRVDTRDEAHLELNALRRKNDSALIISGDSVQVCLRYYEHEFVELSCQCPCVVVCRCSPTQKADIVKLLKLHIGKIVCAVGDGGNDVSMIQAADAGIGIVGKEGKQAALAADFSINQFSYIGHLLMVHGRNSYKRSAALAQFVIHRGLIITAMQAVFCSVFYFASVSLFPGFLMVGYATVFTMFPVFSLVLDKDVSAGIAMTYPELYKELTKGRSLSFKTFFLWVLISIYQGGTIMYGALLLFEEEFIHVVAITFTSLILTELLMVALTVQMWHWLMIVAEFLSLGIYVISLFVFKDFFDESFLRTGSFMWKVVVITSISCIPLYILKYIRKKFSPTVYSKLTP